MIQKIFFYVRHLSPTDYLHAMKPPTTFRIQIPEMFSMRGIKREINRDALQDCCLKASKLFPMCIWLSSASRFCRSRRGDSTH